MTWFRLDADFTTHPAARAAGLKGRALWIEAACHATRHLTDGRIDRHMLPALAALAEIGNGRREAALLVEHGMWEDRGDHWQILNWSSYQPSRADVEAVKAKRATAGAEGNHQRWHVRRGVVSPDCSYCTESQPDPNGVATGSHDAIGVGSQTDRHSTAQHDTTDTYDHHHQTVDVANTPAVVDRAIDLIAGYELTLAMGRSPIDNPGGYQNTIRKRLIADGTRAVLGRVLTTDPTLTAEQLRDRWLEPEPLGSYDELVGPA